MSRPPGGDGLPHDQAARPSLVMALVGAAIASARSERGQRIIADARRKYDTPENRAKVRARDSRGRPRGRDH